MFKRIFLGASLAVFGAGSWAQTSDLISNGAFDLGVTDWTPFGTGSCSVATYQAGDPLPLTANGSIGTTDGHFLVASDASTIDSCGLYQDVSIPAGVTSAVITADVGYLFPTGFPSGTGCNVTVEVLDTSNNPLATVYSHTGSNSTVPMTAQPAVDLTAQAGTTVRVRASATSCFNAPVGLLLDNVALNVTSASPQPVPTLPVWMLGALALSLAGVAARVGKSIRR